MPPSQVRKLVGYDSAYLVNSQRIEKRKAN
jgi:hypothetical protein